MTLPKIIYTVGPPRSGKTEFGNWLLKNPNTIATDNTNGLVLIDEDLIRLALTGQIFVKTSEESVRATKHLMIRTLILQGYAVIVCDTHSRWESIKPLIEIDRNALACFLDFDGNDCIERAHAEGREDLVPVIKRIIMNLQCNHFMGGPFRSFIINNENFLNIMRTKDGEFECLVPLAQ